MNPTSARSANLLVLCLLAQQFLSLLDLVGGFQHINPDFSIRNTRHHLHGSGLHAFKVSVDELEKDLTPSERSITGVVRRCGPSVTYVKSVLPSSPTNGARNFQRRTRNGPRRRRSNQNESPSNNGLPRGTDLGSGSGFIVAPGYICTNFHVIEQAYSIRKNLELAEHTFDEVVGNLTGGFLSHDLLNITKSVVFQGALDKDSLPDVYVRISSSSQYKKCRVVDVNTDIDLAVLRIIDDISEPSKDEEEKSPPSDTTAGVDFIPFGSSMDLLVGQTVVAIGNPFGLQSTVTSGVVSAVNREFRAGTARTPANTPIRNVIQTDAAINPGNSGGPLLNLKGEVVGINTAIITTSGSSAGIGFAVPADQIKPVVKEIIQKDRIQKGQRPNQGWLGLSVVRQDVSIAGNQNATSSNTMPLALLKNWVAKVEMDSPASDAGIRSLAISSEGIVQYGDAIVAVGGNEVTNFEELHRELESRVVGEQVALTVQDAEGKRRVVYVTLSRKPEKLGL
ncbi:unnamed protein product [Pseudo-nitzschia multistriata]|uniref:Uncharacterized protein n=1 Tax=Pseudo-nitzschia multistriata TaxID=183589 RepID=A0A448ZNH9_9STRA|nr:unnamed protein product [Pseudo-nitzschia multistriata]